jgi:ubiquinone/menaquinone biosynthesis C-methylase UbiE
MKDLKQTLQNECYGKDLEQRKCWYSPAAEAYQQFRPRYPQPIIDRVVEIAQLSAGSTVLEVGCGPAIATPAFATLGCQMVCVEPNPDFYRLAQQTCEPYSNVELKNCSFEEWQLESQRFDAVLAASSFHWISPEVGYPKAAAALHPEGYLILLWNKELQPSYAVYQQLSVVYQTHAPSLIRAYEDSATQAAILDEMGQMAIESGYFKDMQSGHLEVKVTYSVDQYLMLLNTYSPHLKLEAQQQQALFSGLREVLEQNGDTVELSYVSAFHITRPEKVIFENASSTRS